MINDSSDLSSQANGGSYLREVQVAADTRASPYMMVIFDMAECEGRLVAGPRAKWGGE